MQPHLSRPAAWACFIACLLAVLFCRPVLPLRAAQEIRLGEIDPLSGNLAKHGLEIHQGILYAVEEANARGGVAGHPVELLSRDDQSKPDVAVNQAQDLIFRGKVTGLVGGYVDALVGPISQQAARQRVPYVASASLQQALTENKNPYFFRVSRLEGIVQPLCRFLTQTLKTQRVGVLHAASPGATEFADRVRANLRQMGADTVLLEKFRPGWPDFSVFLLKLPPARVEALISGGFYADNLILVRQLRERPLGLKAFIAPWGVAYQSFIDEVGQASEGLFGTCAWNPGITQPGTESASQSFVAGFRQKFHKEPNTTTMHGYTSAQALLAAIEMVLKAGGQPTGEAVSQALAKLDLQLPMERLTFDKHGDPQHYQHVIVQIQKQRLVVVYPPERATGQVDFSLAPR
ncbi:MAG: ABC transporter substrate-binding protein [Syntrophobacterales bacterium]|jgi:branched-chain amino acid transport system substrate-binding protein|nr:ABC transporter substrate-binding protein [Syntrophobacterales bacterium]